MEGSNTPLDRNGAQMYLSGVVKSVPDSGSIPSCASSAADDYSYMEETVMTTKTNKTAKSKSAPPASPAGLMNTPPASNIATILQGAGVNTPVSDARSTFSGGVEERSVKSRHTVGPTTSGQKRKIVTRASSTKDDISL